VTSLPGYLFASEIFGKKKDQKEGKSEKKKKRKKKGKKKYNFIKEKKEEGKQSKDCPKDLNKKNGSMGSTSNERTRPKHPYLGSNNTGI
jgi:hypothetical protein